MTADQHPRFTVDAPLDFTIRVDEQQELDKKHQFWGVENRRNDTLNSILNNKTKEPQKAVNSFLAYLHIKPVQTLTLHERRNRNLAEFIRQREIFEVVRHNLLNQNSYDAKFKYDYLFIKFLINELSRVVKSKPNNSDPEANNDDQITQKDIDDLIFAKFNQDMDNAIFLARKTVERIARSTAISDKTIHRIASLAGYHNQKHNKFRSPAFRAMNFIRQVANTILKSFGLKPRYRIITLKLINDIETNPSPIFAPQATSSAHQGSVANDSNASETGSDAGASLAEGMVMTDLDTTPHGGDVDGSHSEYSQEPTTPKAQDSHDSALQTPGLSPIISMENLHKDDTPPASSSSPTPSLTLQFEPKTDNRPDSQSRNQGEINKSIAVSAASPASRFLNTTPAKTDDTTATVSPEAIQETTKFPAASTTVDANTISPDSTLGDHAQLGNSDTVSKVSHTSSLFDPTPAEPNDSTVTISPETSQETSKLAAASTTVDAITISPNSTLGDHVLLNNSDTVSKVSHSSSFLNATPVEADDEIASVSPNATQPTIKPNSASLDLDDEGASLAINAEIASEPDADQKLSTEQAELAQTVADQNFSITPAANTSDIAIARKTTNTTSDITADQTATHSEESLLSKSYAEYNQSSRQLKNEVEALLDQLLGDSGHVTDSSTAPDITNHLSTNSRLPDTSTEITGLDTNLNPKSPLAESLKPEANPSSGATNTATTSLSSVEDACSTDNSSSLHSDDDERAVILKQLSGLMQSFEGAANRDHGTEADQKHLSEHEISTQLDTSAESGMLHMTPKAKPRFTSSIADQFPLSPSFYITRKYHLDDDADIAAATPEHLPRSLVNSYHQFLRDLSTPIKDEKRNADNRSTSAQPTKVDRTSESFEGTPPSPSVSMILPDHLFDNTLADNTNTLDHRQSFIDVDYGPGFFHQLNDTLSFTCSDYSDCSKKHLAETIELSDSMLDSSANHLEKTLSMSTDSSDKSRTKPRRAACDIYNTLSLSSSQSDSACDDDLSSSHNAQPALALDNASMTKTRESGPLSEGAESAIEITSNAQANQLNQTLSMSTDSDSSYSASL